MANILVVAEFSEGTLKRTTHSAIAFAKLAVAAAGGGSFDILVMGAGLDAAAAELAKFGAGKVLVADDASLKQYTAEKFAPTVSALGKSHNVLVAAASAFGKDLMPRVACRLEAGYAADLTEVKAEGGKLVYKRPMFAGNAYGMCQVQTPIEVVTVRQSSFAPAEPAGGASPIEKIKAEAPCKGAERVEWVEFKQSKSERPELTEAEVVVSGGRGCKEKFNAILSPLADLFGAAIGATRAACDAEWAAPDIQVGQTGKIVAPKLYFAIGLSGAIQHLAGMKGSKVIVAVNKDPEAPIFSVADYGLVEDLFKVVPDLVERIKMARQ